jgi:transcription elongation factor Elf1
MTEFHPEGEINMGTSTDTTKLRVRIYHAAAESIERQRHCGCCSAIRNNDARNNFKEVDIFSDWFKPSKEDTLAYWFGKCSCETQDNVPVRVLALCFMAAMVEAGDA